MVELNLVSMEDDSEEGQVQNCMIGCVLGEWILLSLKGSDSFFLENTDSQCGAGIAGAH